MKYLTSYKLFESNDTLKDIIKDGFKPNKNGDVIITNDDFEIKFDVVGRRFRFLWMKNKTDKYKGYKIFKAVLDVAEEKYGKRNVTATGIKGYWKGDEATGYNAMLKWGFIPDMDDVNKILKKSMKKDGKEYKPFDNYEDAWKSRKFREQWEKYGDETNGVFDMRDGSLSWKIFNREI